MICASTAPRLMSTQAPRSRVSRITGSAVCGIAASGIATIVAARPARSAARPASADVAEAYRAQFQLGQRSLLDVLNAENERYNALNGFIAGRAAVTAGEIRLLASLGRLMEALGITMPEQTPRERTP